MGVTKPDWKTGERSVKPKVEPYDRIRFKGTDPSPSSITIRGLVGSVRDWFDYLFYAPPLLPLGAILMYDERNYTSVHETGLSGPVMSEVLLIFLRASKLFYMA